MELLAIFKAILALCFVLGLLLLTLWTMKYCQIHIPSHKWVKKLNDVSRLKVLETKRLDAKNSLVLIEKDNVEHLLLIGQGQNLLVESKEKAKGKK